jgi:hypothetical protein
VLKCAGAFYMAVCIIKVLSSLMRVSVNWFKKSGVTGCACKLRAFCVQSGITVMVSGSKNCKFNDCGYFHSH